ncbi:MAG: phosphoribosylformylglycinamidine cyclo-ligase, partial [Deltaproteobacteria bacterium]
IRIIPQSCKVEIQKDSWTIPPIFSFLQQAGKISDMEMLRTFNNGIGMIAVVPEESSQEILERLSGMNEKAYLIGTVVERKTSKTQIKWIKETTC